MDLTGLPFSPHAGQIATFGTRAFADGNAANVSAEQQSDIGNKVWMMVHVFSGYRRLLSKADG
jgi:hypothetical protein